MRTLNRVASEVLARHDIRGATDVTGFGLLGHGLEMARASGHASALRRRRRCRRSTARSTSRGPASRPAARGTTDGSRRQPSTSLTASAPELVALAHDPQTSGGLLAAVPPRLVGDVEADLAAAGVPAWRVGTVEAGEPGVALA